MADNFGREKDFMLTDLQKKQVAAWVGEGLSLAQIQTKIEEDFGVSMTYMDVRFLVDDLNLDLRDSVPASRVEEEKPAPESGDVPAGNAETEPPDAPVAGGVMLTVDAVQIPGVIASGDVTFSDGVRGKWLVDRTGRPGLAELPEGYRPSQEDMAVLQQKLLEEFRKLGLA